MWVIKAVIFCIIAGILTYLILPTLSIIMFCLIPVVIAVKIFTVSLRSESLVTKACTFSLLLSVTGFMTSIAVSEAELVPEILPEAVTTVGLTLGYWFIGAFVILLLVKIFVNLFFG